MEENDEAWRLVGILNLRYTYIQNRERNICGNGGQGHSCRREEKMKRDKMEKSKENKKKRSRRKGS